jgi:hypothetical protein
MSARTIEVVSELRFTNRMKAKTRRSISLVSALLVFLTISMHPSSAELGGYAVVHPDGRVCGVIVATSSDPFGNGGTMPVEYMGCPPGSRIIFQTKADPNTGNVAGYHGSSPGTSVQYDGSTNSFSISNSSPTTETKVTLIIKDGIATDSSGRSFSTGNGVSATTTLSQAQFEQLVSETSRIDSAKNQRQIALGQAQALAAQTPGVERCVSWSGYLENGQECAIAITSDTATVQTRSVSNSLSNIDSQTVLSVESSTVSGSSDSVTITVKATNEYVTPLIKSEAVDVQGAVSKVAALALKIETSLKSALDIDRSLRKFDSIRKITASSIVNLPKAKLSQESGVSLTPAVCSASGTQVSRIGKGLCTIAYTIVSEVGNSYTTENSFSFR